MQPTDAFQDIWNAFETLDTVIAEYHPRPRVQAFGTVRSVGSGIVRVSGLKGVKSEELIRFPGDILAMAYNVDTDETGTVLIDEGPLLKAGDEAHRTGRVVDFPVGDALIGRVLDARGRPLDGRGAVDTTEERPVERPAPAIMDRAPVTEPLQTGLKVIDALLPIGRGQRELILGDRQTGKTAVALDAVLNQKDTQVLCIYCAIGKRNAAVAKVIDELERRDAMSYCLVVVSTEEDPPGMQFIAPYAAMTVGEHFMQNGGDVLVVFDDLTRHARAYRELSLLLRRPPGREAYPGDIFYIHSRLLERSTHLRTDLGGGSLTALPIVETEAENISAYIPTNLISITDGQIYLSPRLFRKGILPAVEVGKSVSRVGGKTQLPAYRSVAGDLRLSYSQFEELEAFARFGTRMDEETRRTLERGRRVREILKQRQYQPLTVCAQIAVLVAVNEGIFNDVPLERVGRAEMRIRESLGESHRQLCRRIVDGDALSDEDLATIKDAAQKAVREDRETE